MRRLVALVAVVALLLLPTAATAIAAKAPSCTKGDVQSLANGTIAVAKQFLRGRDQGSGNTWFCQFRLYDGNEDPEDSPEVAHAFRQSDWFLGGIFEWVTRSDMEAFGWSHADAVANLALIEDYLYWREQGGEWSELPLSQTARRSVRAPWGGETLAVIHHRYHLFDGGSLQPGVYEWRWDDYDTYCDPPEFTAYGEVHIVAD